MNAPPIASTKTRLDHLMMLFAVLTLCLSHLGCGNNTDTDPKDAEDMSTTPKTELVRVRVATFNTALSKRQQGALLGALAGENDPQAKAIAEIIQRINPDIILLNEMDRDDENKVATRFQENYLNAAQDESLNPLNYDHIYVPATNTGLSSGKDLNQDGRVGMTVGSGDYASDSYGFGEFPGQYGMVVYSKYPITTQRTFQTFNWSSMPNNRIPTDFYKDVTSALRLSSKNHVDVSINVRGKTIHLLASHPTPPGFDGQEDRNGARNHDEIRFWVDYITGGADAMYITDDAGTAGGLGDGEHFVVVGDLNCDPNDGDSQQEAIKALLGHPKVTDPKQTSEGGEPASTQDGQVNTTHTGPANQDTANFSDGVVGNLRVDYALPSSSLTLKDQGVYWPAPSSPQSSLVTASDHRLVWVDVEVEVEVK